MASKYLTDAERAEFNRLSSKLGSSGIHDMDEGVEEYHGHYVLPGCDDCFESREEVDRFYELCHKKGLEEMDALAEGADSAE